MRAQNENNSKNRALLFMAVALIVMFCLLVISELFLRFIVAPSDNFYKQVRFYHSVKSVDIAAFGDSRLSQGFYPPKDSDAVNLAYASESFEQIAQKIDYFLENKKTEKIIIQVGHHMFAEYRFGDQRRQYDIFFQNDQPWKERLYLRDPVLRGNLLNYWQLFFLAGGKIPNQSNFSDNGAVLLDMQMTMPPTPKQYAYRRTRIKEHTLTDDYDERETWNILRATIRRIKAKDIPLCLVSFPVTPFYAIPVMELKNTRPAFDKIEQLATEENVPYLMYWDYYGEDTTYFRNLDHLNKTGARDFAINLIDDCGFN